MAEERENGSPGDEAEQFEVLDEVGEVDGWNGEFPDDDDEQDVEDKDEQVGDVEEKAVADSVPQSNKKQETIVTENEPVCVKPSSVKNNNSSAADKENKDQSETSLNKESSPNKDVKFTASSSTKDVMPESAASKDVKLSTDSTVKRKPDNPGAQEPEAKDIKLFSGNEDETRWPSVEDIKVFSIDSRKEHQLSKESFVDAMINLSEELKLAIDYRDWVEKERKDGMVFPVFDIDQPAEPILLSCCQLRSGYETDSTKLHLGFARDNEFLRFSALEEIYIPAVRSTVKAFEEMVRSSSKPLFDPITRQGFWHGVTVITNSKGETLLQVNLYAANEQKKDVHFTEAKDILVKYFSSRKAAVDCHISSMYLRLMFAKNTESVRCAASQGPMEQRRTCRWIMGNKFIVETISGTNVNLYPWSFFSTGTLAITSLCEAMLKVLLQERCKTVVELGCGTGIVGQFLAKHFECVLGVDSGGCIAEARANADENHLSNCTYFDKDKKNIWTTLDDVLQDKPSVMVIVNSLSYDYLVRDPVITWLTRSNKICRVVCVKMMTKKMSPKWRVISLCTPTGEPKKHHDDPMTYFPLYALPVNLGLGAKLFATILVLQHVESNFIEELYKTREKYTVKCIRIANSTSGLHMVEDDPLEKTKCRSTSPAAKKKCIYFET